jgi:L,D-transpeptidase YnhG
MSSLNMRTIANGRLCWLPIFLMVALLSFAGFAYLYLTATEPVKRVASIHQTPARLKVPDGVAEARLIEIYDPIGRTQNREALEKASKPIEDLPIFQLVQLVYGDLLAARIRPVNNLDDVPNGLSSTASGNLAELWEESLRRIKALREHPPASAVSLQFLALSQRARHVIAMDASKSRLYLFENTPTGLNLVSDYCISVGKVEISKSIEGSQRTPLGIYHITNSLDRKSLKDFYSSGALPINYPNMPNAKRGKTGSGIWLHCTHASQFFRDPMVTDDFVVLANPDLNYFIRTAEVHNTPVVITNQLRWVSPNNIQTEGTPFKDTLAAWRKAKTSGDINQLLNFYTPDFSANKKTLAQWMPTLKMEITRV